MRGEESHLAWIPGGKMGAVNLAPQKMWDDYWVLIPAFNEGQVIANTVSQVKEVFSNVIVVDDNSADDTSEQAKKAGAIVLRHPINLGQGAALETGFEYLRSRNISGVVTFDADGQHRPEDALAMVKAHRESGKDLILGSRFLGTEVQVPPIRRMVLRLAVWFSRLTTGLALTDSHNGLRVLGPRALESIRLNQNQMAHASEVLSLIAVNKLSYQEQPITIRYSEYSLRKGQKLTGAIHILFDLLIERLIR